MEDTVLETGTRAVWPDNNADKLASGFTEFLEKVDDFHVIMLQT